MVSGYATIDLKFVSYTALLTLSPMLDEMSRLYFHRLQYLQIPSIADTLLFRITDTYFGPVRACAIVNNLA